ncbi:MAG: acyltransferase [Eubacterium sp.]|nr:acyltransferase [Eubacterium sp.]
MESALKEKALGKQNNAIDLAKFICAVFVVAIHVPPFGSADGSTVVTYLNFFIQDYLARIAVPFFFITSGYFLFKKTDIKNFDIKPSKQYVLRLIKLYLIWSLIYFPVRLGSIFTDKKGILHGIISYFKDFVFSTSYSHLWYLNALIFATIVISFLLYKRVKPLYIIAGGGIFYFLGLFGQSWFGFLEPLRGTFVWDILKAVQSLITTTRDGLFDGLIFVGIGMLFAYYEIKISRKSALTGLAVSLILLFTESFGFQFLGFSRSHDTYLFLVPTAFFLFAVIRDIQLPDNRNYKKMRTLSSLIYFIHPWIKIILGALTYIIFKKQAIFLISFALTFAIAYFLSLAVMKLSEKPKSKWLKNLYS